MKTVEKIAQRLYEQQNSHRHHVPWEDRISGGHIDREYIQLALTALETLRANSGDLLDAGIRAKDRHYDKMRAEGRDTRLVVIADHPAGTIFDAMIDAAIEEVLASVSVTA